MRFYTIRTLTSLACLLTTTSAQGTWYDGYHDIPVGQFSYIVDGIDSCSVTIKTEQFPDVGRVCDIKQGAMTYCGTLKSPILKARSPLRTYSNLFARRPEGEDTDKWLPV